MCQLFAKIVFHNKEKSRAKKAPCRGTLFSGNGLKGYYNGDGNSVGIYHHSNHLQTYSITDIGVCLI